jgi:hypothetical protein
VDRELAQYHVKVLDEIEKMKEVYGPKPHCYFLSLHLRSIFNGTIWYDMDHCIFGYRGRFYDHTGELGILEDFELFKHYNALQEYDFEAIKRLQTAMFETKGRNYE